MAVTIVSYAASWSSGLGATQAFPTQAVAAGDLLAVIYFADKVDILPTTAPSDNLNGAWTKKQILAGSLVDYLTATAAADSCRVACAYKKNSAAGSMDLSLPWASDAGTPVRKAAYLFVVSGLAGGGDIDQCIGQAYAALTGTSISAGTFATFPQADTACVQAYEGSRADSGIVSGWTRATDLDPWLALRGGRQVSTTTTGLATGWTKASNSLDGVVVAMSFKDFAAPASAVTEAVSSSESQAASRTTTAPAAESVTASESVSATISSAPPGTFTSGVLKRNTGVVAASSPLTYVSFCNAATGLQLALRTGLSTASDGRFTATDAAMVAGGTYRADWLEASGERGWDVRVAT